MFFIYVWAVEKISTEIFAQNFRIYEFNTWCTSICICHQIVYSKIVTRHGDTYRSVTRVVWFFMRQYLFRLVCEMAANCKTEQPVEICNRKKSLTANQSFASLSAAHLLFARSCSFVIFQLLHCICFLFLFEMFTI